ncbi:hypothetical protein L596_001498 [Steinernema carpocapsae]|uniref:Uncharacterized protein n=1 Tax=Steinernema carpocapsae TaxID=34508 RepID=A0A4V6I7E8_STECR|nr:hypothetical protein L596_001498 [Steinernema carpocapsae]
MKKEPLVEVIMRILDSDLGAADIRKTSEFATTGPRKRNTEQTGSKESMATATDGRCPSFKVLESKAAAEPTSTCPSVPTNSAPLTSTITTGSAATTSTTSTRASTGAREK